MNTVLENIELKAEIERVKLLLQKCNGDIVRSDREYEALREVASNLLRIAESYHIREVTYTEMPYKNWTAIISKAKALLEKKEK